MAQNGELRKKPKHISSICSPVIFDKNTQRKKKKLSVSLINGSGKLHVHMLKNQTISHGSQKLTEN